MQARASRSCRGQQERKCRSSMRYFTGQSTTLTHRAALPHLGSAAAIPCVNIRLGIRNQLIEWFRQAAARLPHVAIARNPRRDRRVPEG